ncbi:S9 family peptidase [Flammeovirga kamogawensis]|nr:prolyl oligopeptidase family serine peptidase [Flammeovirga kamogawensis]MBB6461600.1 dipeptidyl aminopeptidase/acylaminoacyl peptidase [Flammeovirga kamogawensis]TRX69283.1 prolyl oligopeptidase family serine peptidase [Flammeovirga kamogawensis]
MNKSISLLSLSIFFFTNLLLAQNNQSVLTFDEIMSGETYIGHSPHSPFWAKDSKTIYFYWNKENKAYDDLFKVDVKSKKYEKVSTEEQKSLPIANGDWNKNHTKKLYIKAGNLFIYDFKKGVQKQITNTLDKKSNAFFLDNENSISYTSNGNVFIMQLNDGVTTQVSNFTSGTKKGEPKLTPQNQFLHDQQLELFEIVRKREDRSEEKKEHSESLEISQPSKIYLGKKYLWKAQLSYDTKHIVYSLGKKAGNYATEMPVWVEGTGYVKMQNARPKVGSPEDTYTNYIFDINGDSTIEIDLTTLDGIYDTPKYYEEYPALEKGKSDKMRDVVMHSPTFSKGTNYAIADVRAYDNKDRWIILINLLDGSVTQIDRQHDDAWIGGPGISGWNFWIPKLKWIDSDTFWYQSENDGYSHIYTYTVSNNKKRQLTKGDFEVHGVKLSNDGKSFYVTANKEHPGSMQLYKLDIASAQLTKITSKEGNHETLLSPDEKYIVDRYSFSNKPWELYLQQNKPNVTPIQLTSSTTKAFDEYEWRSPEVVTFKAEDNKDVHARLYKPTAEKDLHKAVIFVHGAGYLQNAHKWWSVYYREYMFHNMLVDNGYTVLDIDFRASEGYGSEWRTAIYRNMGGKDLSDQVDGAKFLIEQHGVDAKKIGIYGGSYGGFITMMAMFKEGDTFQAGAAIRSVTDWAHYNHPYTSNILNTPALDPIAYKRSSPIYLAEGLKGNLLILHGMVDDNVQFSDVVRLSQRLIELKKENWNMAIYPIEPHGFKETSSWIDEYKRIFNLFQSKL